MSVGVELGATSRLIWRGLERTARPALIASGILAYEARTWEFAGGAWSAIEPWRTRNGRASLIGSGRRGLRETDLFAQAALLPSSSTRLTLGVVRYGYAIGAPGRTDQPWHTSEVYGRLEAAWRTLEPEISLWYDVDRVRGAYAEYGIRRRIALFPADLPPSLIASALIGWSYGQHADPAHPNRPAYFERGGYRGTDLGLSTVPVLVIGRVPVAIALSVHYLAGRADSAAISNGRSLPRGWWTEIRLSAPAYPRQEAPAR